MPSEEFEALEKTVDQYAAHGRNSSSALLVWFLEHVKRLDLDEAIDCVCDGRGDKGIDGIFVDDILEEVVLLQAKYRAGSTTTQGDSDLQKLVGAAAWFSSAAKISDLLAAGPNAELVGLIEREELSKRIDEGYSVRCVFVTNTSFDSSGSDYLSAHASGTPPLEGWGLAELDRYVKYMERQLYVDEEVVFTFPESAHFQVALDGLTTVFGAISAEQVAALPGIEDRTLFAQNVRLNLGRTRVNKDITRTLADPAEHAKFLTFHNGLTILCRELEFGTGKDRDTVRIANFSVVNGCQSVVSFHDGLKHLTSELLVPVRLVKVGGEDQVADDITYRSNNQNPINLKDLRANDATQVALQAQFRDLFGGVVGYEIKRGEVSAATTIIANDLAGQILLALYNEEPWMAHRKFDLFDKRYKDVFHPRIGAVEIYLGYLIWEEVRKHRDKIENQLMAYYGLTAFVLVYLVGVLLRESGPGRDVLDDPAQYVLPADADLRSAVSRLVQDLLVDFNGYARERAEEDGYFDYKTLFKSQRAVSALTEDVKRHYQRAVIRTPGMAFAVSQGT